MTDGAKAMVGSQNGLVGLLKKKENLLRCFALHNSPKALCGKVLKIMNVMRSVAKMVNLMRGEHKAQRH